VDYVGIVLMKLAEGRPAVQAKYNQQFVTRPRSSLSHFSPARYRRASMAEIEGHYRLSYLSYLSEYGMRLEAIFRQRIAVPRDLPV